MTQHTSEPWVLLPPSRGLDNNWHVTDIGDTFVAHVFGFNHAVDEKSKANARRIVACVNACAGIPTDVLEGEQLGSVQVLTHHQMIVEQRDELLGLLCEARDRMVGSHPVLVSLRDRSDAAIAKIKGAAA